MIDHVKPNVVPHVPGEPARLRSLDGLRGLAALSVVFAHAVAVWPVFWNAYLAQHWGASNAPLVVKLMTFTPLHVFRASKEAVVIFFILSGLVLALPVLNGKSLPYSNYLIRRITRLVPVFILAMSTAFVLASWSAVHPQPTGSAWLQNMWLSQPRIADTLKVLGFVAPASDINPPTWTLIHEMRISLIFPILSLFVIRRPVIMLFCSIFVALIIDIAHSKGFLDPNSFGAILATSQVIVYFVVGISIAKYRELISNHIQKFTVFIGTLWISIAIIGLFASWMLPIHPILFLPAGCIGAAILVILSAFWPPLITTLDSSICQYLGRISYSLYLIHLPVLLFVIHLFPNMPRIIVVCGGIAAALVIATIISEFVEWPLTRQGKILASKMKSSS